MLTALNNLLFDYFEIGYLATAACVARTWPQEIGKGAFEALVIRCSRYEKDRLAALRQQYIINRENVPWLVEKTDSTYDPIAADELSSRIGAQAPKALMKVRPWRRVIGPTGTPSGNGLLTCLRNSKCWIWEFAAIQRRQDYRRTSANGQVVSTPLPGAGD